MKKILLVLIFTSLAYSQSDSSQTQTTEPFVFIIGSGIQNSANFETDRPWQLGWTNRANDMVFSVYLMNAETDKLADVLVSSTNKMGDAYSNKVGKFYLKIAGMGDWIIFTNYQDVVKQKK